MQNYPIPFVQTSTLVHKLPIFWFLHPFSYGRKENVICKTRENRSLDSNPYSMNVNKKRIHTYALEIQMLIVRFPECTSESGKLFVAFVRKARKNCPRKNASSSCTLLILLWVFCFYIFSWWYFIIWTFWQFNGFSCFSCSVILQESYT